MLVGMDWDLSQSLELAASFQKNGGVIFVPNQAEGQVLPKSDQLKIPPGADIGIIDKLYFMAYACLFVFK